MKITEASLRKWLVAGRQKNETLRCSELGGFHVRVNADSPKGSAGPASYRIQFRVNGGKLRTPTIAKYGEITLGEAKKRGGTAKAEGKAGIDKLAERKETRRQLEVEKEAKANALPNFQQWFDQRHHERLYERGTSGKLRISHLRAYWLPHLGQLTLEELNIDVVCEVLRPFGSTVKESTAKKYVEYLKEAVSRFAEDYRAPNNLAGTSWPQYVRTADLLWKINEEDGESPRTAFSPAEFTSILNSIESVITASPDKAEPLAMLFMAHTGMRPSDIRTLEWKHLVTENCDFPHVRKILQKTRHKKKTATIIPLSPNALKTLGRAKPISGGVFVFSETSKSKSPKTLNDFWWRKVKDATGVSATIYQLRHNMAHAVLRSGGSIADVAAVLGNTVEACIRNYLNEDPRHAAQVLRHLNF